jgi:hypothetical protein
MERQYERMKLKSYGFPRSRLVLPIDVGAAFRFRLRNAHFPGDIRLNEELTDS